MPNRNYPNDIAFDFIKKTVWRYDHLPVGKFWKFWYNSSGFRNVLEPSQNGFGMLSKTGCCRRFIPLNICESRQKLGSGRRREPDFHDGSRDRIKSASATSLPQHIRVQSFNWEIARIFFLIFSSISSTENGNSLLTYFQILTV
jgi:hypothetical protein